MSYKFALKAGFAAMALAVAGAASAGPFYIDIGRDYSGVVNTHGNISTEVGQICATCTSMKDEFTITYQSKTTIFDIAAPIGSMSAGDLALTDAGLLAFGGVGALGKNRVTGFNPGETNADSDNGYGASRWQMSFSLSGLGGIVTSVVAGVPSISYGPGLLQMYLTNDGGITYNNFMDIAIFGGAATGLGTVLIGKADFTNVDAGFNNLIHSGTASCLGSDSFFDIWTNCGGVGGTDISFVSSFDTNVTQSDFKDNGDGTFSVASDHDGSGTFNIPEPGSLALLGLALAGLGLTQRRRKLA